MRLEFKADLPKIKTETGLVFDILSKIEKYNLESTIYQHRSIPGVGRASDMPEGVISDSSENPLYIEIKLPLMSSDLNNSGFDTNNSIIKEFFGVPEIADNKISNLQVYTKKGNVYEAKTYGIVEIQGGRLLTLISTSEIKEEDYKLFHPYNDFEYGGVIITLGLQFPTFALRNAKYSFVGTSLMARVPEIVNTSAQLKKNAAFRDYTLPDNYMGYLMTLRTWAELSKTADLTFTEKAFNNIKYQYTRDTNHYAPRTDLSDFNTPILGIGVDYKPEPDTFINIVNILADTMDIKNNNFNPLDPIGYSLVIDTSSGVPEVYFLYEGLSKTSSTEKDLTVKEAVISSRDIINNSVLFLESTEPEDMYQKAKDELLGRVIDNWKKFFARFDSLYQPTSLVKLFIFLQYMSKYYIPSFKTTYIREFFNRTQNLPMALKYLYSLGINPESDYGVATHHKYFEGLPKIDAPLYSFDGNRLVDNNETLRDLRSYHYSSIGHPMYYKHALNSVNIEYPCITSSKKSRSKIHLLVDDTFTKTTWKNKIKLIKEYEDIKSRDTVVVIRLKDKFQKILFSRLVSERPYVYYTSAYDALYKKANAEKKAAAVIKKQAQTIEADKTFTIYHRGSIKTSGNALNSFTATTDNPILSNCLLMEYSSSKNEITFAGQSSVLSRTSNPGVPFKRLCDIVEIVTGKKLVLVSKSNIKTLKAAGYETLEDHYLTEEFEKNVPYFHRNFTIVRDRGIETSLKHLFDYILTTFNDIYLTGNEFDKSKMDFYEETYYSFLHSMPEPLKTYFLEVYKLASVVQNADSYRYNMLGQMAGRLISWNETTDLEKALLDKMNTSNPLVIKSGHIQKISNTINEIVSRYKIDEYTIVPVFASWMERRERVLENNLYLNLDKEVALRKINAVDREFLESMDSNIMRLTRILVDHGIE